MSTDRGKAGLVALIRSVFSGIDYLALYRARVVVQNGMNVDVQPDDVRIPGLSGIPLQMGLPSAEVTLTPGCYVLVGWRNGDSRQPFAVPAWESGAHTIQLKLNADTIVLNGGTLAVARATDQLQGTAGPYPLNGIIAPTAGNPTVKA